MSWKDTLFNLLQPKKNELENAFQESIDSIDTIIMGLNRYEKDKALGDEAKAVEALVILRQTIEAFSFLPFQNVRQRLRFSRRKQVKRIMDKLGSQLKILDQALANLPDQLPEGDNKIEFLELKKELELIQGTVKTRKKQMKLVVAVLYLLPALLGYLVGVYLRSESGFQLVSQNVKWPADAYQIQKEEIDYWKVVPHYKNLFFEEFSEYYFNNQRSNFESFFFRKEPDQGKKPTLEMKFVIKNKSRSRGEFTSGLEIKLTFEKEVPFPWRQLNTTPEVIVESAKDGLDLCSDGIGPAADLEWNVTTSKAKIQLFRGDKDFLLVGKSARIDFSKPVESFGVCDIKKDNTLSKNLYYRLSLEPGKPANKNLFKFINTWYEIIETPDRLMKQTQCIRGEDITISLKYRSLKGKEFSGTCTHRLPGNRIYYRRQFDLLEEDPRKPIAESPHTAETQLEKPSSLMERLIESVLPALPSPSPTGVDTLVKKWSVNVDSLLPGERIYKDFDFDVFINPRGVIIFYMTLKYPSNGIYHVSVKLNGEPFYAFKIEALVPENFEFHPSYAILFKDH